ncbi:hypothetical protein [Streptomyces noursei]|uniref:hypothetical protein n=1 Tax=Streptomyces noursei TaxID=1971 RepID=UPI0035D5C075
MYRLTYDPGVETLHDQLPPAASAALTVALQAACHDPLGNTAPRGIAEEWNRAVHTDDAIASILVSYTQKTIVVLDVINLSS